MACPRLLSAILAAFGLLAGSTLAVTVALAWLAHTGMDRMLGLKLR